VSESNQTYRPYQLRLVCAAIGAGISALLAVMMLPASVFALIPALGTPVGAVVGYAAAPRLVATERPTRVVFGMSGAATLLGSLVGSVVNAYLWAPWPGPLDGLAAFAGLFGTWLLASLLYAWPFTLGIAGLTAYLVRRVGPRTPMLWRPAVAVLIAAGMVAWVVGTYAWSLELGPGMVD
jgi:hypothetical protein